MFAFLVQGSIPSAEATVEEQAPRASSRRRTPRTRSRTSHHPPPGDGRPDPTAHRRSAGCGSALPPKSGPTPLRAPSPRATRSTPRPRATRSTCHSRGKGSDGTTSGQRPRTAGQAPEAGPRAPQARGHRPGSAERAAGGRGLAEGSPDSPRARRAGEANVLAQAFGGLFSPFRRLRSRRGIQAHIMGILA